MQDHRQQGQTEPFKPACDNAQASNDQQENYGKACDDPAGVGRNEEVDGDQSKHRERDHAGKPLGPFCDGYDGRTGTR